MFYRIATIEDLREFCASKIRDRDSMLKKFDEDRAKDQLERFLSWNATSLLGAVVQARRAENIISFLDKGADQDDQKRLEIVRQSAFRQLDVETRVSSRSSLLDANVHEDYEKAFWKELFVLLEKGRD